jgi:hypothetical protein
MSPQEPTREGAQAVGAEAARVDYDGGYRTLPTDTALEGVLFPMLKTRFGLTDRAGLLMEAARRAYRETFLGLLARPPRPRAPRSPTRERYFGWL